MTVQSRTDAQMKMQYSEADALAVALRAIAMLKAALRNETVEVREAAVTGLIDEAPTFAHRKALYGAALYLLIDQGWEVS